MAVEALESHRVEQIAHTDIGGRPAFKMAIATYGGRWYMYVAHFFYSGWSILDITDPANPELLTHIEGPPNTMTLQMQVADDLMITSLEPPREGYGLDGAPMDPDGPSEEGAYVWSLRNDPTEPELVGHYETGGAGTHRNFYAGGQYAYCCSHYPEFEGAAMATVDVSDPSNPTEVGRWWWPGQAPDEGDADYSFYFHGPAYLQGERAYLSYGRVGAVALDMADPTDPALLYRLPMADGIGSFLGTHSFIPIPNTDLAAITTEAILGMKQQNPDEPLSYLAIADIGDERPPSFDEAGQPIGPKIISCAPLPTPESHLPYASYYEKGGAFGPHNVHHYRGEDTRYQDDDLLFVSYFNAGLRVFDISDPRVPEEVGYYVPEDPEERIGSRPRPALVSHFEDIVVDSRGYIYCTDPNHGLFVLRYEGL